LRRNVNLFGRDLEFIEGANPQYIEREPLQIGFRVFACNPHTLFRAMNRGCVQDAAPRSTTFLRPANRTRGVRPLNASATSPGNHGAPKAARPISTPSAPVCTSTRRACSTVVMSPLANTGMPTAAFTAAIVAVLRGA
jgi:hypothetical protein